jgi:copper resistance protein C
MIFCPRFLVNLYLVDKRMKALIRLLLTAYTLLLLIQGSWAHAFVDHTEPAVGSQIHSAPTQVKIWFTERLEPALSKIQVFDTSEQEIDKRDVKIDQWNAVLLTVSLPGLKPGKYKVTWRAVSVDTHVTTGNFMFELV